MEGSHDCKRLTNTALRQDLSPSWKLKFRPYRWQHYLNALKFIGETTRKTKPNDSLQLFFHNQRAPKLLVTGFKGLVLQSGNQAVTLGRPLPSSRPLRQPKLEHRVQDHRAGDPRCGSKKSGAGGGKYGRDSRLAGAGVTQKPTPHENAYQGSELSPFPSTGQDVESGLRRVLGFRYPSPDARCGLGRRPRRLRVRPARGA